LVILLLALAASPLLGVDPAPDPNTVTSVSQLPLYYRYEDDEWAELMAKNKITQAIEVDTSVASAHFCTNCAVILHGILLFPPFILQLQDDRAYVNGYPLYPPPTGLDFSPRRFLAQRAVEDPPVRVKIPQECVQEEQRRRQLAQPFLERASAKIKAAGRSQKDAIEKWLFKKLAENGLSPVDVTVVPGWVTARMTPPENCRPYMHGPENEKTWAAGYREPVSSRLRLRAPAPLTEAENDALEFAKYVLDNRVLAWRGRSHAPVSCARLAGLLRHEARQTDPRVLYFRLLSAESVTQRFALQFFANYTENVATWNAHGGLQCPQ
jgi:hypothetical protein